MLNLLSIWIQNDYHNFSFIMAIRTQITYLFILFLYSYDTFFLFIFLFSTGSLRFSFTSLRVSVCTSEMGKKWKEISPPHRPWKGYRREGGGGFFPGPHLFCFCCSSALEVVSVELLQSSCCKETSSRENRKSSVNHFPTIKTWSHK